MSKFESIDFQSYNVNKFSLQEPDKGFIFKKEDLSVNIETSVGLSVEDSLVQVTQGFSFLHEYPKGSGTKVNLLNIEVEAVFGNIDISSFEKEQDEPVIPEMLLYVLAGLTASTTRGIVIAKTAGTFLGNNLILPIINPKEMVSTKLHEKVG